MWSTGSPATVTDPWASPGPTPRAPGGCRGCWRLADPPREDSAETIAAAQELGVEVKMVTGDQVAIGREIARQVGLGEQHP